MMSSAVPTKSTAEICVVDQHPAESDCRRVQVDFKVELQIRNDSYNTVAVAMCGAGMTLNGIIPAQVGDAVALKIFFPGIQQPLAATGKITHKNAALFGCEFWVSNSYEQQFLDGFVTACARRHELRQASTCKHER